MSPCLRIMQRCTLRHVSCVSQHTQLHYFPPAPGFSSPHHPLTAGGATISTGAVISLNRPAGQSTTDGPYTATLAVDSVMTSFQSTALSGDTKPYWCARAGRECDWVLPRLTACPSGSASAASLSLCPCVRSPSPHPPTHSASRRYVDLGAGAQVTGIQIASRDNCCQGRISDLEVRLGDSDPSSTATNTPIAVNSVYAKYAGPPGTSGQQVGLGWAGLQHACNQKPFGRWKPVAKSTP